MLPSFPKFFPAFSSFVHNSPAFFTERLKQKSQHTAANSTMSTAFVCAFRFPREVRFTGAWLLKLRSYSCFLPLFLHSFFLSHFDLIFIDFWVDFWSQNRLFFDQKMCYFFDRFSGVFSIVFFVIFNGPIPEKSLKSAVLYSKIRVSRFLC